MTKENNSDIDEILERAKTEEPRRGKIKIFFGAMAGVGKTYSMLEAARVRKREGVDVVVGYVETHKRAETDALLEGLETLPVKKIPYKNIEIREFDIDAALKRHPALILVDELAHTNAPGSRHLKRWQDVDELLDAGADVFTTLNVQHCESANDVVAQITGITVRETVPDTFIEKADDIELVDLPPEDLLQRLQEGKVYLGEQAERAAENFFQIGNLIALRQLALQYTSRSVDAKMRSYKQAYSVSKVWSVRDRFLICISSSPAAVNLIRAGKRIASAVGVEWVVVYVENPSQMYNRKNRAKVVEMMRFAERLGAETVMLTGYDVSEALITYARSRNITKIIVGKPGGSRWKELAFGSVVSDLARKCGEIDLYLIGGEAQRVEAGRFDLRVSKPFPWASLLWTLAMVTVCSVAGKLLTQYLGPENIVMFYLSGVTLIAYRYGLRASLIASLFSVLAFDFFFVEPHYTFVVDDAQRDLTTFVVMFSVSFVISFLTTRLRQQAVAMVQKENRARALYYLNRDLARTSNPDEIFQMAQQHIQKVFKCPVVILTPAADKRLVPRTEDFDLNSNEQAVAAWVFEHEKMAGRDTDTLPGSDGMYLPMIGSEKTIGVVGLFPQEKKRLTDPDDLRMLEMFVSQAALAVEGAQLAANAVKAESDIESERLRNLLLSTFSFELPAPLKSISDATAELLKPEMAHDAAKRAELIKKIRAEAERLTSLSREMVQIIKSEEVE